MREAAAVTSVSRMRRETSIPSSRTRLPSSCGCSSIRVASASASSGSSSSNDIVALDRLQCKRAIHCSGLQVEESETARQMGGERALPRAGRAVDGDDWAAALLGARSLPSGLGWSCIRRIHLVLGLNLRPGGRFPKGFLFPANLAKVLLGLPVNGVPGLAEGLLAAKAAARFAAGVFRANPPGFPAGLPANFRCAKSPAGRSANAPLPEPSGRSGPVGGERPRRPVARTRRTCGNTLAALGACAAAALRALACSRLCRTSAAAR